LREQRRALIEAAEVEHEIDEAGRVWQVKRLPSVVTG
jgi:hypothetical protein